MRCGKCKLEKERDGYVWCYDCRTKQARYMREYMRLHPEKNRSNVKSWRDKNPDKRRRQTRKYKMDMRRIRPLRYEYEMLKKRAGKIGLGETMGYDDYAKLIVLPCHYCGAEPTDRGRGPRNGLDRVDNERGYVLDNVVTASVPFAKLQVTQAVTTLSRT